MNGLLFESELSMTSLRKLIFIGAALAALWQARARAGEPLPVNPAVSESNIAETICMPGWSATQRPPVAYTNRIKMRLLHDMGLPPELLVDFVLDHRISISAGGSPDALANLVLQDRDASGRKDRFEEKMHHAICAGEISLRQAQELLWNWKDAQ